MTQDKWWDKTVTIKDAFIPTYASPGRSFHQYGLGFDIYDVTNDPINEKPDTDKISAIAKKYGRNTVFGTEVDKLVNAGYVRKGDYFIHPDNIAKGD